MVKGFGFPRRENMPRGRGEVKAEILSTSEAWCVLEHTSCPCFLLFLSQKLGMKVVVSELVPAHVCDAL